MTVAMLARDKATEADIQIKSAFGVARLAPTPACYAHQRTGVVPRLDADHGLSLIRSLSGVVVRGNSPKGLIECSTLPSSPPSSA